MASIYVVVEVTIKSARGLHNINSPNGDLKPYAVVWVDAADKRSTMADVDGGTNPVWNQTLIIPLPRDLHPVSAVLSIHIVHAGEGVNSPVGAARLHLREVVDEVGIGGEIARTLDLYLTSEPDRMQGSLEVKVRISDICPPSYGQPFAASYGHAVSFAPPPSHGHNLPHYYVQPPAPVYYAAPPPAGYGYGYGYGQQTSAVSSFGGLVNTAVGRMAGELLVNTAMEAFKMYDDST